MPHIPKELLVCLGLQITFHDIKNHFIGIVNDDYIIIIIQRKRVF